VHIDPANEKVRAYFEAPGKFRSPPKACMLQKIQKPTQGVHVA